MQFIAKYASLIVLALQLLAGWVLWSMRKEFASKRDVEQLQVRLATVERALDNAPSAKETGELRLEMERMRGEMRTFSAEMRGTRETLSAEIEGVEGLAKRVTRTMDLVTEHLINRSRPVS